MRMNAANGKEKDHRGKESRKRAVEMTGRQASPLPPMMPIPSIVLQIPLLQFTPPSP
jgi:hypothetical protein